MTNQVFVLGAMDPEMQEIERVLTAQGLPWVYAVRSYNGNRVQPVNAYSARHVSASLPRDCEQVVMVECNVEGLRCDVRIDHHHEGDPGFGKKPHEYMQGSSLGQLLSLLGLEPTQEQRVTCAADHCLTAAYRGECLGVTPAELADFRIRSRSANRDVAPELLHEQIEAARVLLGNAPRVDVGGSEVAWIADADDIPELSEASARFGIPFMYRRREDRYSERMKAGILGASAKVIRSWMNQCELADVYGDPERGFAGGYYLPA